MPDRNHEALAFLLSRRSRPARTLAAPAPSRAAMDELLTAATRVPDHGKLEPWRLIVLQGAALARLAALTGVRAEALGKDERDTAKAVAAFAEAPMIVAVIFSPKPSEKSPEVEQLLSAGCVCLSLVNAALAAGWGAAWITGIVAFDRVFQTEGLGLAGHESVAGFVHIGTQTAAPPERPRPDLAAVTSWVCA